MTSKYTICPKCRENTPVKTMATDRVELEREEGEFLETNCKHCHERLKVHVNDVQAKPNKIILAAGGLAGVAATAALWQIGFVAVLSLALPGIVYGVQQKAASDFNAYKIKRG